MKKRFLISSLLFILLLLIIFSSTKCNRKQYIATPYHLEIPKFFPTILNIPEDNPLTIEGVALGKLLFEDERLCGYLGNNPDSMMSCATCHNRANNYDVGLDNERFPNGVTFGLSGINTPHSPLPLVNLVFNNEGYFWNGMIYNSNPRLDRRNLEDVVSMGITAPHEFNGSIEKTVAAISSDDHYRELFFKAFGTEEINIDRIEKAIAQYIRTLISANSKFDRYMRGEEQLTPQELNGYILFTTEEGADCFHCHGSDGTPLFTTNLFYNNGLDNIFEDNRDRYAVTGNTQDIGAYRAPTLRNIEVSAPYMHDGRFKTLDEVLEFYNSGVQNSPYIHPLMHKVNEGGMLLTPMQIADLKAFLLTLTDDEFIGKQSTR